MHMEHDNIPGMPQVEYTPGTGIPQVQENPPAKYTPGRLKTVQFYVFRPLGKDGRRLFSHFTICSFEVMFSLKSMFTVTYNKVKHIKGEKERF
jgi:hypothetical protein